MQTLEVKSIIKEVPLFNFLLLMLQLLLGHCRYIKLLLYLLDYNIVTETNKEFM